MVVGTDTPPSFLTLFLLACLKCNKLRDKLSFYNSGGLLFHKRKKKKKH